MLAARSSWRLLEAEHVRIRELVVAIDRLVKKAAWRKSRDGHHRLLNVVLALRRIDDGTHRPKGVTLVAAVRLRGAPADLALVDDLTAEQRQCEALIEEAARLLAASRALTAAEEDACVDLLVRHNSLLLVHLAREDSALRACAERVLTNEDWSEVASSISHVVALRRGSR